MDNSTGRSIILLGSNGSGKSSVGNSLLGKYVFSHPKLSECKQIKDFSRQHNISLNIIDTPGLFDADVSLAEGALELQKSLNICPNPHAFLIVVNTNDGKEYLDYTVDMLPLIFGENVFDNAIVFVNHRDDYAADSWVNEHQLVSRCGRRVVTAKTLDACMNKVTGAAILKKVSLLTSSGVSVYTHKSIELHRRVLIGCMSVCGTGDDIRSQLNEMNTRLKAMLDKKHSSNIRNEIKVVMIGKSGNGKSSTGNTLLGYNGFTVGDSLNAVTEKCHIKKGCLETTQIIKVVDTPGTFDEDGSFGERALEIQKAVKICPNPNAFVLVFSSTCRFTEEERYTIDLMRIIFGDKIFDHMCIVFTHGSKFQDEDHFKKFWKENKCVKDLVERCNGRIFKIENLKEFQDKDENILNLIKTIKDCPEYKYRYLAIHQAELKDILKKYTSEEQNIKMQIEDLDKRLNKRVDAKIWNKKLLTGAAIVGSAVVLALAASEPKAAAAVGVAVAEKAPKAVA
ncbi:GTPase IMAP family member 8-like [Ruditapes philippinarum]|uniref:GTPase IMAP family member 8-like n=1 Tax=Ruditapes philippinarum TaxID=129788 RepID=UPI00295BD7BE|nr:GTPase IMAP family member 8-like [Ruditapes philippinarum]XP_060586168.1 GTPase IMAP family member 8-like [Ruditapes philippinarum]